MWQVAAQTFQYLQILINPQGYTIATCIPRYWVHKLSPLAAMPERNRRFLTAVSMATLDKKCDQHWRPRHVGMKTRRATNRHRYSSLKTSVQYSLYSSHKSPAPLALCMHSMCYHPKQSFLHVQNSRKISTVYEQSSLCHLQSSVSSPPCLSQFILDVAHRNLK